MLATLRQQGGAAVLTVPTSIIQQMGWQIGNKIDLQAQGETVVLRPVKRQARGRKSVAELLAGIDSQEIQQLNADIAELEPIGKEVKFGMSIQIQPKEVNYAIHIILLWYQMNL